MCNFSSRRWKYWEMTSSLKYKEQRCNIRSPLMKTPDWSVDKLDREFNRTPQLTCKLTHFRSCYLKWFTFYGYSTIM